MGLFVNDGQEKIINTNIKTFWFYRTKQEAMDKEVNDYIRKMPQNGHKFQSVDVLLSADGDTQIVVIKYLPS